MKLLIPTTILPPKKNIRTIYVENIAYFLKKKIDLDIIWVNISSEAKPTEENLHVLDFKNFSNANDLLNKIKPDCVLISSSWESIQYSLSLSCKFLKIPIFSFFIYDFSTIKLQLNSLTVKDKLKKLKLFFLKTNTNSDNKSTIKGIFFLKKYLFLTRTRIKTGIGLLSLFKFLFNDFFIIFLERYPIYNKFCDYYLLPDKSWIKPLTNFGIDSSQLIITGNPFWDKIYNKISCLESKQKPISQNHIKLLIVTDSLVEHGIWTVKKRDFFLSQLTSELLKTEHISFDFKIHPSSENPLNYEKLFNKLKIKPKIFQNEDLWDLINNYDLVLSYGSTTAHSELVCGGIKLIIFNPDEEFYAMPMVEEGILNGHVLKCTKFDRLLSAINELNNKKIQFSQRFLNSRFNLIFQFQGKASENVAKTILSKIKG